MTSSARVRPSVEELQGWRENVTFRVGGWGVPLGFRVLHLLMPNRSKLNGTGYTVISQLMGKVNTLG
ncbi:hypothetical protein ART_3363 [Arthrobacter sp. PAMC 25486]|nr:hypothetical protein ART_3363 [Arthrobacter sp. PAMC 25486]